MNIAHRESIAVPFSIQRGTWEAAYALVHEFNGRLDAATHKAATRILTRGPSSVIWQDASDMTAAYQRHVDMRI